jgi:hypothetical protein
MVKRRSMSKPGIETRFCCHKARSPYKAIELNSGSTEETGIHSRILFNTSNVVRMEINRYESNIRRKIG